MRDFDVIIVGAGPAGSYCARLLGNGGLRVLLLDKDSFPREKPGMDVLSPRSQLLLSDAGILEKVLEKNPLTAGGIRFISATGTVFSTRFPNEYASNQRPLLFSHEQLNTLLFEHASKVCSFRENVHVVALLRENGRVSGIKYADLSTKETKEVTADLVVGADGPFSFVARSLAIHDAPASHVSMSVSARYAGIDSLSDEIEVHFSPVLPHGYFWIVPLGENTCSVGVTLRMDEARHTATIFPDMLNTIINHPSLSARFEGATLLSAPQSWSTPLGSFPRRNVVDNVVLIGDAAGLGDPLSHESLTHALWSGSLAAKTILTAAEKNDYSENALLLYSENIRATIEKSCHRSARVRNMLKNDRMVTRTIHHAAANPQKGEKLSERIINNKVPSVLSNPLDWVSSLMG